MIDFEGLRRANQLAEIVARYASGARRVGARTFWCCPFHAERTPSFTLVPDGEAYVCFGCGAKGDVIDFIRRAEGLDLAGAVAFLGRGDAPTATRTPQARARNDAADRARRTAAARAIWRDAAPAAGTPVEHYLCRRGISLAIPPTLRHHGALAYGATGRRFHAMVAAVQAPERRIVAVHRTFLNWDGCKADVPVSKMALGPLGAGAVRLGRAGEVLGLAEGIESALSAAQLSGVPVWAALGARLHAVAMPPGVREVHIFADNGAAGRAAAEKAAEKFTGEGRRVVLRFPPEGAGDYNDVLGANRTPAPDLAPQACARQAAP